ncbi:MAG: insulinase family protein [Methylobacteriaceae bacterium]|nr:insulinase family protein [Methylobacteriaceae bacterium]
MTAHSEPLAPAPRSRAASVQKISFAGGCEAWLVEDYAVPLVALECAFPGGAAQDAPGKAGCATMLSALLDEGAGPLDDEAFHRALDEKAIELSFSVDRDTLRGHLRTLAKHVEAAFDLLRLAVNAPRFDERPVERVRAQITAGLKREANDPDSRAAKAWREAAFPDHPYGRPTNGTLESIAAITRDDLVAMRRAGFARDGLKVAIVGAIDATRARALLEAAFGALPQTAALRDVPEARMANLGAVRVVDIDLPQSTIRFGAPGVGRRDPDYDAAVVVNHILGGGVFSARLFKEVREKRGLAYSVHSGLQTQQRGAIFAGATSTKNERAAESLSVIESEIAGLAEDGPTDDELAKAKSYLTGSYALRFDSSTKIAGQLVQLQIDGFDVDYLDRRNALIEAVTMDDAKRVAKRLFGAGQLLVAVAGRPEGIEGRHLG